MAVFVKLSVRVNRGVMWHFKLEIGKWSTYHRTLYGPYNNRYYAITYGKIYAILDFIYFDSYVPRACLALLVDGISYRDLVLLCFVAVYYKSFYI